MADHARTHALNCLSNRTFARAMENAPTSTRGARATRARRFSAIDANATLMLSRAEAPAAATIAKSAMQTYIDGIRDLAELVV